MPTVTFEPASAGSERTQTHAIERARYYCQTVIPHIGDGLRMSLYARDLHSSWYAALHQLAFGSRRTGGIVLVFKDRHSART